MAAPSDPTSGGADAYLTFCQQQSVNLIQTARMMKATILLATAQNELPASVRAHLYGEFAAMAGMVEVKAATE